MDGTNAYLWLSIGAGLVFYTIALVAYMRFRTTVKLLKRLITKRRHLSHARYLQKWRAERFDIDDAKL
jgi:hypothetical protein